jgi:alkanesulfonate monooxygenase SsuD/methylene tetrahydromethanopterin reductase-like flavin-dependent oxidoreductase (luciferase family)
MLDTLSNGRLLPGVFRGTPNELMVYHTNPTESRARYEEAVLLLQRCWSEPEPFGWEGVHYRYRSIAVWPRPAQPRLPLLVSANSETSAQFAGTHHLEMGFSLGDLTRKAAHVAIYKAAASEAGWTAGPENLLTRYIIYVGQSDQKAREDFTKLLSVDGPPDPRRMAYLHALMAAGVGKPIPINSPPPPPKVQSGDPASKSGPAAGGFPTLVGSPDTLLRRMEEIVAATGVGRFDLIFTGAPLPYEMGVSSLKLFAREMLPTLQKLDPQPAFDRL